MLIIKDAGSFIKRFKKIAEKKKSEKKEEGYESHIPGAGRVIV